MKQIKLFENCDLGRLETLVNDYISEYDSDNIELQFNSTTCQFSDGSAFYVFFSCMVIIKICK